jgi:GH24 family phage-related lysozyme (muramidase)
MRTSSRAVKKIAQWEEFVPYPYDDKVPKQRDADGRLRYPEWTGGPVRGTITIGFGHTDAAGAPKITIGMRVTEAQGWDILGRDLRPCERDVLRIVQVKLTQHQFDAMVSFTFNCGAGNLKRLVTDSGLNDGNYANVPTYLMHYVTSRGADGKRERMRGLVNRRTAEIALWNLPDDPREAEVHEEFSPKATEDAPPKSPVDSKTITAAGTSAAAGAEVIAKGIDKANEATAPIREAQDNLQQLGIWDQLIAFVSHHQLEIAGALIVGLCIFIAFDRWRRLKHDHV